MRLNKFVKVVPVVASAALVLAACGSNGETSPVAQSPVVDIPAATAPEAAVPEAAAEAATEVADSAPAAVKAPAGEVAKAVAAPKGEAKAPAKAAKSEKAATSATKSESKAPAAGTTKVANNAPAGSAAALTKVIETESAAEKAENQKIYDAKGGATEVGVTKDQIKLGSINMHGMALGNVLSQPMVRGNLATASAINDRGGILGRRLNITDCDDGPGEVSRAKACIKKLVGQDKIFSLVTGVDWATASIHDDLKQYKLPYIGAWAYSQTEWQDPYMFPSHMSMIHEAMAGA
ncbi:MAG: ABC transporter substrate-binding protein, partial [Sporichthyaceae bacterium]